MTQKRYPGASPFTSEQQHIFFGRDKDIDKLYKLILLRNQVLLYSKSGIGKTSLLNAGVMPRFEKKFLVVNIRFTAYNEDSFQTPVKRVIESVKNAVPDFNLFEAPDLERIVISGDIDNSFWLLFKKLQMSERIDRKIILVFDQFEELFTYPDHLVAEFATQLYELTRVDIPDTLMLEMAVKIDDSEQRSDLLSTFSEDMGVKTVFAIRSDRLSLLNKLSDKIRDIQETFYELAPLTIEQVNDAIVQPAKKQTAGFETQPFEYT